MSRVIPPHLTKGSTRPPLVEGKLRLYSMEYCPFAQRVRLVLLAKKIPHDIVNINLIEKPEWYFDVNPKGLVPAIDTGSDIVTESLNISNWLEEKFTDIPLYPNDPIIKQRDKELISTTDDIVTAFTTALLPFDKINPDKISKNLKPYLEVYEKELLERKSLFFRGAKPGMLDYMFYPWAERFESLNVLFRGINILESSYFPLLNRWNAAMNVHPVCADTQNSSEMLWKYVDLSPFYTPRLDYKGLMKKDDVTAPETAKDLLPQLEVFEKELASRGSTFFGGQTPGMVDYMLWPFAERSKCLQYSYGTRIFQENQLPLLRQWKKAMLADPACSQTYNGPEKYWKLFQNRVQGLPVDYDNGLVPAIDTGSEVIVESLDIANWLDKNYAQNPLIPSDPAAQDRDQRVISEIGDLVKVYSGILFSQETQKSENAVKNLNPSLRFLENELASRNSVFFGGDKPSMVDYMLWPWGERSGTLSHVLGEKPPFSSDQFPALKNWKKAMREDSVCDQIYHGPEIFWKVVQNKKQGVKHYENIYS